MATITTDTFLDGGVARTAGEAMAIGNGAKFTIRTDTRVHANAPASFTGSLGNPTFTDIGGELFIDATAVRWLAYDTGSGNVPAIGTSVSQGGVSGYLLGVWSALNAAPTAVGAAMPASGFIKFREVTGGAFAAGALTGIGASATGVDVTGWIECVWDAGVNFVIGRVGKMTARGAWFNLADTDGTVGQQIQLPSSSAPTNNNAPGVWVETAPGSDAYEFWPGLKNASNGWTRTALGFAEGFTDRRGRFVKADANGIVKFGETATLVATYASLAAQSATYAGIAISGTYTWADDVVTVNTGATAHLLDDGQVIGLDFTSGSGVDAADFVVTVIDAYNFSCARTGSGTGGNVTVRPGITVTFTSHGMNQGESTYCDFTSGTGVDGTYVIYAITSANAYNIAYPHTAAITSGNVSCLHSLNITYTAHGHVQGQEIYCDFTSGGATNGKYVIKSSPDANTIRINFPHAAAIATGDVTMRWTIGHVPASGCKVRIPNIMFAECATGARALNTVPNATTTSRPEFTTTTAGAVDLEYLYCWSVRASFDQAYSVRLRNCAFVDIFNITECATALDVDGVGVGQYSNQDARAVQLTSNFAGGNFKNVVAQRATLGTTDHAFEIANCSGLVVEDVDCGIILYARSTGYPLNIATCQNLTLNRIRVFNGPLYLSTSVNIEAKNLDYNDRFIGKTNSLTAYSALTVSAGCDKITLDGMTLGMGGTLDDCQPYNNLVYVIGATNIKVRNLGTPSAYLKTGTWAPNLVATALTVASGGNNNNVKVQRIFCGKMRSGLVTTTNSDNNVTYEQVLASAPWIHSAKAAFGSLMASLNTLQKGMTAGTWPATAQTSVYGTHWHEVFLGGQYGNVTLTMNEPTAATTALFTVNAGVCKFNSAGGIEMRAIGASATWEMPYFAQGHTGFANITPVMTGGGAIGNFRFRYQINKNDGNGWSTITGQLTAAQLQAALYAEVISPTAGFKLRIQIDTTTANTAAVQFLRIYTTTSTAAQNAIDYPLDTVTLTLTGLQAGSDVVVLEAGTNTVLDSVDANGSTTWNYIYEAADTVDIGVLKAGYVPLYFRNLSIGTADASLPVTQQPDRNYAA